eukprot:14637039-Alexandrium_andersonii.AAC.1
MPHGPGGALRVKQHMFERATHVQCRLRCALMPPPPPGVASLAAARQCNEMRGFDEDRFAYVACVGTDSCLRRPCVQVGGGTRAVPSMQGGPEA